MKTKRLWFEWHTLDFNYLEGLKEKFFQEVVPWAFSPPQFGSDEFDNHSIYWKVLGFYTVIFYEKNLTPSDYWYFSSCGNDVAIWRNLEYEGWVEKPVDFHEKRFMGHFEDYHGIEQTQWCPPAPISQDLMDHLIKHGMVKYCYEDKHNE